MLDVAVAVAVAAIAIAIATSSGVIWSAAGECLKWQICVTRQ